MSEPCSFVYKIKDTKVIAMEKELIKFQCDICGQKIKNKKNLDKHFDRHRDLKCEICDRRYLDRNNLKNHLRSHFDKNYYVICDVCGKSVSSWKLKRHKEQHEPIKRNVAKNLNYSCRYCGLNFDKVNNRSSHEKRMHKTKLNDGLDNFKCQDCHEIFKTKHHLREHSFKHFSGKIYFCDFKGCNKYFKKGKLVTVHKRCHFDPQFKCLDCGQMFVQRAGLSKHRKERCPAKKSESTLLTHDEISRIASKAKEQYIALRGTLFNRTVEHKNSTKSNKSDSCLQSPSEHEIVKIEIRENNEDEEWQYEFLDEALFEDNHLEPMLDEDNMVKFDESSLQTSLLSKIKKPLNSQEQGENKRPSIPLECNIRSCRETFDSRSHLTRHKREFHSENDRWRRLEPFICDRCGKGFYSRSSIQTHLLVTHKTVADYKCTHCLRNFKSHGNLYRHVKSVHENEKLWGCEKCGKMFKERYQLDIHLHNHDEPSECMICRRMVSNMKVHLRNHTAKSNNAQTKCHLCGKSMGKYQLARHVSSVHEKQFQRDTSSSNLKVYACKECGDFFSRKQELRQHEYIHFSGKIFFCEFKGCNKFFKKLKLLNVHRFTHMPQNVCCEICKNVYARKSALWKHQKKNHPEFVSSRTVAN